MTSRDLLSTLKRRSEGIGPRWAVSLTEKNQLLQRALPVQ